MAFHPVDQSLKCRITLGGLSWLEMNNVRYYLRDFEKSPFSKVIKFRESTEYTGARFLNFHFYILFNHNGPERQQATG